MTDEYRKVNDEKLVGLLFTEEDRLPRAAVDEILRRGGMVSRLGAIVADPYQWNEPLPAWWAVVHAVYILGAVGTPDTVLPLLKALRYAEACENDWVAGDLPSIFGAMGVSSLAGLKAMAADATTGWFARAIAVEGMAAVTIRHPAMEREVFDIIGRYFLDEHEDRSFRQMAGHVLLDFLRTEQRDALERFGREERQRAEQDAAYKPAFTDNIVLREFSLGQKNLDRYTRDWLSFYTPQAIAERHKRWEEETRAGAESPEHAPVQELCPFATDRKRKKCCIGQVGIA